MGYKVEVAQRAIHHVSAPLLTLEDPLCEWHNVMTADVSIVAIAACGHALLRQSMTQ